MGNRASLYNCNYEGEDYWPHGRHGVNSGMCNSKSIGLVCTRNSGHHICDEHLCVISINKRGPRCTNHCGHGNECLKSQELHRLNNCQKQIKRIKKWKKPRRLNDISRISSTLQYNLVSRPRAHNPSNKTRVGAYDY